MSTVEEVKKKASNVKFQAAKVDPGVIESVVVGGDLSKLTPIARITYYKRVCDSLGLNPLTKPFDYIVLNGKLTLYARKDCTQQLCKIHKISTEVVKKEKIENIYVVTVRAKIGDRCSEDDGAVDINGLSGDKLCNAMMKAVTKAKRRAVLGICGLGHIDESETGTTDGEILNVDEAHNGLSINDVKDDQPQKAQPEAEDAQFTEGEGAENPPNSAPEPAPEAQKPASEAPAEQPTEQVEYISEPQRKRLLQIASKVGQSKDDVKAYIKIFGITSTTKIRTGKEYDNIVLHFETMASGE